MICPDTCQCPVALCATAVTRRAPPGRGGGGDLDGDLDGPLLAVMQLRHHHGLGRHHAGPVHSDGHLAAGSLIIPGPSFTRVTLTIWSGLAAEPENRSVETTSVIRMPHGGTRSTW